MSDTKIESNIVKRPLSAQSKPEVPEERRAIHARRAMRIRIADLHDS